MAASLHEDLLKVALVLAEGLDREAIVQRVTDEATRLSGAQFGAFFYNVKDGRDGAYTLYTLSGAPREAFARFPMPRATAVFAPTFEGTAVVRSDDITKDPRYGKNAPRHGMPEGHLPVRSYLAVPVRGSTGVLGGLFFGHGKPGVFTAHHEELVVGIARLAAPALENAHLHQQVENERRRWQLINRATNDAVWDWDLLHDRLDWNDAVQVLFGYAAEDIGPGGAWWKDNIHPDDRDRVLEDIYGVIDGARESWVAEYRFRRKNGTYADILDRGNVIRDETGRAVRMLGSMLDLTVRRTLERKLEASEERLRRAVEASGVGTWDFDPQSGRLTWDTRTKALFGLSPDAHVDYEVFLRGVHPDDRALTDETVARSLDPSGSGHYRIEYRTVGVEDGVERWIAAEGRAFFADGRATRFIGTVLDITERKHLEAELAYQNRLTGTITSNASLALFMMDDQQRCTFMNPAAEKMTGFTLDEIRRRGEPLHDIIHYLRPDRTPYPIEECPIDRALPTRARERGEDVFVRSDGTLYPVAFTASPIIENERPMGTVIEVRDTTEEKRRAAETQLAERRFRTLIEATSQIVWTASADGTVHESPSWNAFTGQESTVWSSAVHPEDDERLRAQWADCIARGVAMDLEFRLRRADGVYRTMVTKGIPLRGSSGKIREWIGTTSDVTEAREATRALERAEVRFRRIFDSNVVGFVFTRRDGRIVDANDYFLRLVGYGRDELQAAPVTWHDLTPTEHAAASDAAVREADENGTSAPIEKEYQRRDGSRIPVVIGTARLAAGLDADFVTFVLDISARKRAERVLSLLARTGAAMSGSLDARTTLEGIARSFVPERADWCNVFLRNDDGTLTHTACAHVDPSKEDPMRALIVRAKLDDKAPAGVGRVVRTGVSEIIDHAQEETAIRSLFADELDYQTLRSFAPASSLLVPLVDRGRALGVIDLGVTDARRRFAKDDIEPVEEVARRAASALENARLFALAQTERRRAEEANRAKDEFLAVVSHELRTPLNAILGWSKMLASGMIGGDQAGRAIATIERNARAQAQLIEDLLDVSRIITGKLKLQVAPVDIARVVESALDVLRPAAEAKGVRLQSVVDNAIGVVQGDADRLRQVVWNLLANAVKFTPKDGRVLVRVSKTGSSCEIVVEDTGRGIAREFLPRVFDAFRQDDASTTRAYGGLGLGLAIVRHIAELHGGTVEAHSDGIGRGAAFVVKLPISALGATSPAVSMPMHPGERADDAPFSCPRELDGLRVLVVDDEPDARDLLANLFASCRADVRTAASADDAFAMIEAAPPDILVSDIGMPGTDGYALIERVRRLPPERGGRIAAVALTAYARNEDRTRALLAGFSMHVAKPVDPSELLVVVANLSGRLARTNR